MSDHAPSRQELERRLAEAEAALREREGYYRSLIYTLHEDILVIDRDWRVVDCNNTRLTTTGHLRDEVVGRHCFKVLHGRDVPCEQAGEACALRQVFASGEPANCHHEHRQNDGTVRHVDILFSPLKDPSGTVTHVIEAMRDVSDLFAAQEAQRRAASETEATLASITDGFFALDRNMVVTFYNPAAARALGRPAAEVLGRKLFDAFPEARGSIFEARYTEALREQRALSFETYFGVPPFEGWYEVRVYPREEGISVFFQVITERRKAREALERSEQKFRTLFEMSPDAIAVADDDGRYVDVNPACCELFGVQREGLIGRTVADFAAPGYDTASAWQAFRSDGAASGVFRLQRSDGTVREIQFAAVAGFQPGRHLSLLRDVTDRVRQEQELRRRVAEYRTLADSLPDIVVRFDPELRHTFVSKAIEPVTGRRTEEFVGRTDRELGMPPELVASWEDALRQVIETGQARTIEYRFSGHNGDRHFEGRLLPDVDEEGGVRGVLGVNRDVTERVEAERALRESEARYRQLFDAAPVGIGHWDAGGRLVAFNAYAKEQMGGDATSLTGRTIEEIHGDRVGAIARRRFADVEVSGESGDYEDEVELPTGTKWFTSRYSVLRDETGGVGGYLIASVDITERKHAEQRLRRSEARLQKTFDVLPIGLWFADADGTLLRGNPAGVAIWGAEPLVPPSEYGVFKARRLPSGEEVAADDWALARTIRDGVTIEGELLEIVAFDGTTKVILNSTAPVVDDGELLGAIVVNRDVTESVRAEQALRDSEARYRLLADNSLDVIWQMDLERRFVYASPAVARVFGYTPEELVGTRLEDHVDGADLKEIERALERELRHASDGAILETRFRHRDGHLVPVEVHAKLVLDGDGTPRMVQGTTRDVSQRKKAEQALRDSEERYRRLIELTPDAVFVHSGGRFTFANQAGAALLGAAGPELLLGRPILDFVDAEYHALVKERVRGALEDGALAPALEERFVRLDGSRVAVEVTAIPFGSGERPSVQVVARSIEERQAAERAVLESRRNLAAVLENTDGAIWSVDRDLRLVVANSQYLDDARRGLGISLQAGDSVVPPQCPPDVAAVWRGYYGRAFAGESFRLELEHGAGASASVSEYSFRPIRGEDGVGAVTVFRRDVTERRRAERELAEALTWQRHIFEGSRDAVFISDADSRFVAVNRAAEELTGYGRDELLTLRIPDLHDEPDLAAYRAFHDRIFAGEALVTVAPVLRKDGGKVETEFSNAVIEVGGTRYMHTAARDITERVAAERALREQTEFLGTLIEALPFPVFYKGYDGRYLGCNQRFLDFFGRRREEVIGSAVDAIGDEVATAVFRARDAELFAAPGTQAYEIDLRDASGTDHRSLITKATFNDALGRPAGIIGSILDLSELRRAEAAEQKRLRQLAAVNRVARQVASLLDQDELLAAVARGVRDAFGYHNVTILVLDPERRELVFRFMSGVHAGKIAPGYRQSVDEGLVGAAAASGSAEVCNDVLAEPRYVQGFEGVVDTRAEVAVPIVANREVVAVLDVQENHVGAFDETDVQMLETVARQVGVALANAQLFQRLQDELAGRLRVEAEQLRLATAVEQAAEAIVITDRDGTIEYVNPAFERVSGYGRQEIVGATPRVLKSGRQDAAFYEQMWRTICAGEVWSGVMVNRRKDGNEFTEESVISPIRDADGRITHFVAVKRDVTREREVEEQLLQMQKLEAIGRLAGGVAHDFNNLLQALLASAQMLVVAAGSPDAVTESAREIEELVRKGSALTRQLLLFARRGVSRRETVELGEVVSGSEKLLRRLLRENVRITVERSEEALAVAVDRSQIEQVIMNLAVNAADAMAEGGTLRLASGPGKDGEAWFEVADTGAGIPDQIREKIFEPFFTTKSADRGTGLGLAVVHGIVTQHGGRIAIDSTVGVGTAFRITLPLEGTVVRTTDPVIGSAAQAAARGSRQRILVVEDNDGVRLLLARLLERLGYRATAVGSGEEAEQLPSEPAFDVLLSDIMLPGDSGPTLARRLKQRWPELAVILMSGYAEDEILREGLSRGEFHFLQKPIELDALARELQAALTGGSDRASL